MMCEGVWSGYTTRSKPLVSFLIDSSVKDTDTILTQWGSEKNRKD